MSNKKNRDFPKRPFVLLRGYRAVRGLFASLSLWLSSNQRYRLVQKLGQKEGPIVKRIDCSQGPMRCIVWNRYRLERALYYWGTDAHDNQCTIWLVGAQAMQQALAQHGEFAPEVDESTWWGKRGLILEFDLPAYAKWRRPPRNISEERHPFVLRLGIASGVRTIARPQYRASAGTRVWTAAGRDK